MEIIKIFSLLHYNVYIKLKRVRYILLYPLIIITDYKTHQQLHLLALLFLE